jgi:DNA-binding NarL/FixJ family response regulator
MPKKWTEEEETLAIKLRDEGFTSREIALRLQGRTAAAVKLRLSKLSSIKFKWSQQDIDKLLELKQERTPNKQIAYQLGRTVKAVEAKLRELQGHTVAGKNSS